MSRKAFVLVLPLLLVAALPALAQESETREFEKTVAFEPGGHLRLETFKGSVVLRPWEQERVEIKARIAPPEDVSEDYARRAVEATRIEVHGGGRSLTIRSDYDDVPCREERGVFDGCSKTLPYVHYEIRAPRRLDLSLDDHKSRIELAGFEGAVELDTHKGTVQARDLSGRLRLATHKGTVELARLQGRLDLRTHKGVVEASEVSGEVRLSTHKGRMELSDFEGNVAVETHRGTVTLHASKIEGSSRLETHRGTIELYLPEAQGLTLDARIGRRADFHSDFDITARVRDRERLEGTINGGGPRLYLETERGEIRLKRPL